MIGGGLMELVAYGAQDVYLTGNTQMTYFKTKYTNGYNYGTQWNSFLSDSSDYHQLVDVFENDHLEQLKLIENLEDFKKIMLENYEKYTDRRGYNYYMLMSELGIIDVLKYLEELGYDPNVVDINKRKVYDIALEEINIELMEYLEKNKKYTGSVLFRTSEKKQCDEKCMICQYDIKKDDIYCQCEHGHIIHKECCLLNEQYNNRLPSYMHEIIFDKNYTVECLYCKKNMLDKSIKCL